MNTTENNKLIAEFMGARQINGSFEMYGIIPTIEDGEDEQHFFYPHELKFNEDWNWLMEVVYKIRYTEQTAKDEIKIKITFYQRNNKTIFDLSILEGREYVYKAVIEFIKWYNLNK